MADRKKRPTSGCSTSASKRTKRQVTVATCEKWQRDFNRDYQSLLWLRYDVDKADRSLVDTLYCEVCRTYKDKIRFIRNFSGVWVTGSTNHKSSNIVDHGNSAQHTACMAHMRAASTRAQNKPAESYAPIACWSEFEESMLNTHTQTTSRNLNVHVCSRTSDLGCWS